jgi:hypothetical protein
LQEFDASSYFARVASFPAVRSRNDIDHDQASTILNRDR